MQSIRRISPSLSCSGVMGVSVEANSVIRPWGSSIRTQGIVRRRSSVAMYQILLAMFMCQ